MGGDWGKDGIIPVIIRLGQEKGDGVGAHGQ
jgi:hypothetical protein